MFSDVRNKRTTIPIFWVVTRCGCVDVTVSENTVASVFRVTVIYSGKFVLNTTKLYGLTSQKSVMLTLTAEELLTFKSLAVSLHATRFNIQNFYMVLALR
jgi:hypothetical protein